ncbi:MAG: C2H2-type zinc finger protein [Armatimonadetes bacterium]|nr:C2H2-type zinc finger protein [Armatimonadota bacterium]
MHECEECGELFVDEESLENHMLTHFPERAPESKPEAAGTDGPAETAGEPPPREEKETRKKFESPLKKRLLRNRVEEEEEEKAAPPIQPERLFEEPEEPEKPPPAGSAPAGPGFFQFLAEFFAFLGGLIYSGQQATSDFTRESVVPAGIAFVRVGLAFGLVVGVLLVGVGVGRLVSPLVRHAEPNPDPSRGSPTGTPVILDRAPTTPQEVVQDFYRAIDLGEYARAYGHLSPAWKRELPFALFERGYSTTQSIQCGVLESRELSSGEIQVVIQLEVLEAGRRLSYTGHHIATLTPEGWKLDSGALGP